MRKFDIISIVCVFIKGEFEVWVDRVQTNDVTLTLGCY